MDFRADIYSPLQNVSLWMASWLHHQESFDETIAALRELGGHQRIASGEFSSADVFAQWRRAYTPGSRLRLLLAGPGMPLALPPAHPATLLSQKAGGAVILSHENGDASVFIPIFQAADDHTDWHEFYLEAPLPQAAWLSPGDADTQLRDATYAAAHSIAAVNPGISAPNPRLTVGSLTDYYDSPGLPPATPPRSSGLIARANAVTAVLETTMQRYGIHEFDPELLRLGHSIRQARMTAVDYAVAEWGRRAG
ncbi:MAG: hypothetical protein Q3976_06430 [Corynebacterium sp.]|nr:hypothetical protein [Corynebacterium sp.]